MNINIKILLLYLCMVVLTYIVFHYTWTPLILLQNTLFFIFFSLVILFFHKKYYICDLTLASIITYIRIIISIIILSGIINSHNPYIYNIFYTDGAIIYLGFLALILDGADGYIARKYNQETYIGELFDQEADNFLILIMVISLYMNKNINIFAIMIPLYRYIFLASMYKFTWLSNELPRSIRRKSICIISIFTLIIAQSVLFSNYISNNLSLFVLFIITFSFTIDIIWLYRNKYEKK